MKASKTGRARKPSPPKRSNAAAATAQPKGAAASVAPPPASAAEPWPTPRTAAPAGPRARIRVYRHGLGDCILIRLRRRDGSDYTIMIDCGVAMAQPNGADGMKKVVKDVVATTGGKVDVLAVTHQHWDHVSGFTQAEDEFKNLSVGEVWVAWTEDPNDPLAKSLQADHASAMAVLGRSAQRMAAAGRPDRADEILNTLGVAGASGDKTKVAFDKAKSMGKAPPRYWQPDATQQAPAQQTAPIALGDPDVTIYALGPPYDAKAIRNTLPSASDPETYAFKFDGGNAMPPNVLTALTCPDGPSPPFAHTVTIPMESARGMPFFLENYWGSEGENWRRIDAEWLGAADQLALAMQSATNNTSLVLAIELAGGDVLLFAGDAQVGNWESWQARTWTVNGRTVTGPDLLKRAIFYKVGHHGSHNATLRQHGLEMMSALKTAIIPVDHAVALKMRWGAMPLDALVTALDGRTSHRSLRTDVTPAATDGVEVTDLYYEVTV
ncbi:MAG TPA: MBL fold metallo-hydrolase [Xanthobacteraceae bacterium]